MKLIELVVDEEGVYGVDAMSIVEDPAIGENFVAFKSQGKPVQFKEVDKEKRILLGAALIPNLPIYRQFDDGSEGYVYMSTNTVRSVAERFISMGLQNNATLEHEVDVEDCAVVESWIKEGEHDKSQNFGMDLPDGTWVIAMKVKNDEIWSDWVKAGKVKGFSIEAFMLDKMKAKEEKQKKEDKEKMLREIEETVKNIQR